MFKKILFATSATKACDPAARVAFNLSNLYKAQLSVFHVVEDENSESGTKEKIENYYAEQLPVPDGYNTIITPGAAHEKILEQILKTKSDLLVMGVSAGGEASLDNDHKGMGSTFQEVVKASQCPVMIVNRSAASFWGSISNVVFATDFSALSDRAFDFAYNMAKNTGSELRIFHAQAISLTPGSKNFDQDAIEKRIREKLRFFRQKYVSRMEGIDNYSIEVWEGNAYIEIVKYAREKYSDLIVMAQDSQNPGARTDELGSTIKQVILRAGCPVLCMNKRKETSIDGGKDEKNSNS